MLKRLRWRFILVNMLLVGLAFSVLFGAVCVINYRKGRSEVDLAIESASRRTDERPLPDWGRQNGEDGEERPGRPDDAEEDLEIRLPMIGGADQVSFVYTVTVFVADDGNYFRTDAFGAQMDAETLNGAVEQALASSKTEGDLNALNLAWKKTETTGGTRIVFASTDYLWDALRATALTTGIVLLCGLVLFFGVSYLLSGIVIRPTARAWEQQKRFVADASHDLKTPITVILANTEILRASPGAPPAEREKWLEGIAEEGERMKGMVNEMLELAQTERVESLVFSSLSLSDVTEQTLLQMEPLAFEKGVSIESEIDEGIVLPSVEKSYVRLLHILVDNAVKYSPKGETVWVKLVKSGSSGAVLTVRNAGKQIPAEDLPHLFDRFWRADQARETTGGFGLGLSIAKNLAEQLHAKISVASDPGATTFTVTF